MFKGPIIIIRLGKNNNDQNNEKPIVAVIKRAIFLKNSNSVKNRNIPAPKVVIPPPILVYNINEFIISI